MGLRSSMAWLGCFALLGFAATACVGTVNVGGGSGGSGGGGPLSKADKIDLLLVVDNSRSMADKQEILARATTDLVQAVTNPPCVDANGNLGQTPATPNDPCPAGQTRRFSPVSDIHVGVISTSIGGHGSDSCPDVDDATPTCQPNPNLTNNDKGHLLSRQDACELNPSIPTYQNQGFLAWDLNGVLTPQGTADALQLSKDIASMVLGVGQIGCGYEAQLESWYRFLVDPQPYASISVANAKATPSGVDNVLLSQRAAFLRPDSMLVILQLTDENDCSINESGQYYVAAQLRTPGGMPFRMPRPRSECAMDPNDPCCKSCGTDPGACPVDPSCTDANGGIAMLSAEEDEINLRCFDQKRRFGIDFLYPVDRYIKGLTQAQVADRDGNLVPNPIFTDLNPGDGNQSIRDPGLVLMASITGVPWQDIARDPADLTQGFQNASEMTQAGTWDAILGSNGSGPTSPFMRESIAPRAGVSSNNPINGGDRSISQNDDLQYACIFPLSMPKDCTDPGLIACDCQDPTNDSPICAPNPTDNGARTLQIAAKAYPSTRNVEVVKALGDQGVLTSICPAQATDATRDDYAYRPVVRALVERMATRL